MKKVLVIGSPGAGKSTFSRRLQEILGMPIIHMDKLFWKPGWVSIGRDELEGTLRDAVGAETWIIDGNYLNTLDIRMKESDTIIYLDYPLWVCLLGVINRYYVYRNKEREDMTSGCKENLNWEFVSYVIRFPWEQRPLIYEKLKEAKKTNRVTILKNRKEAHTFVESLKRSSSNDGIDSDI